MQRNKKNIIRIFALLFVILTIGALLCACKSNKDTKQIEHVSELSGKTIASESGTIHAAAVKMYEGLEKCNYIYGYTYSDCVAYLMTKKADAIALDYLLAKSVISSYDGLILLDEKMDESQYGFAFRKGDPLQDEFNTVLAEMKESGKIDEIVNKWTSQGEKTSEKQSWTRKKGVLVCQVSPTFAPVCYTNENGDIVGIDVDIIICIAEKLNYQVIFAENDHEDIIPSLIAGESDMAASGITITDARKEQIDFSDGYLDASTVLIVRDINVESSSTSFFLTIKNSLNRALVEEDRWKDLLGGLITTLLIVFVTICVGTIIGSALFLWEYSGSKIASFCLPKFSRLYTLMPMSTWLLICYYLIFPNAKESGYLAAYFGLSMSFAASTYSTIVGCADSIPSGQKEAARAMGYNRSNALKRIFIPQMLPNIIPSMEYNIVYHVKDTSLVSFVTVIDIQAVADSISKQTAEPFIPIILTALIYTLLNLTISLLLRRLHHRVSSEATSDEWLKKRTIKQIKREITK